MSVSFATNVLWPGNPQIQKIAAFKIKIPGGVAKSHLRAPNYVDAPGMSAALKSGTTLAKSTGNNLGTVNGLVTSDLKLRFDDPQMQWASRPMGGADAKQGPVEFSFKGGKVHLDLSLGLFVMNSNKPRTGDTTSAKIFSVVYSHELLHVFDNLDMINKWFIPKLKAEPMIDKYLEQGKPYVYGRSADSIAVLMREFFTHIQEKLETEAFNLWATEANRRQGIRDAPGEYRKVQEQIEDLRSSYVRPK